MSVNKKLNKLANTVAMIRMMSRMFAPSVVSKSEVS